MFIFNKPEAEIPTIFLEALYSTLQENTLTVPDGYIMIGNKCTGVDLDSISGASINFQHGDFSGAKIVSGTLLGGNFNYATLNGARFSKTDLKLSTFRYNTVVGLRMTGCNLEASEFREGTFESCVFSECDFSSAIFHKVTFESSAFINCAFIGNIMNQLTFKDCLLNGSFFRNMLMTSVVLDNTDPSVTTSYPFAKEQLEACRV